MKKVNIIISVLLFFLITISSTFAGNIMIVVNKAVEIKTFTSKLASDIYLGNKTRWDDGKKIVIVLLRHGKTHKKFTKEIINVAPEKLGRFWKRAYFSGSCNLPKICKSEEKLIDTVASYPGAIGYIDSDTPHDSVKGFVLK